MLGRVVTERPQELNLGDPRPVTFTATAAYPYENREQATAGIRAALRHQLLGAGVRGLQVWETLVVTDPTTARDARANTWFEYRATVESTGRHEEPKIEELA